MKTELKPCPFCGGEAGIIKSHGSYEKPYVVVCKVCGASRGDFTETKEKAIKAWSRREPIDKVVEALEDLQDFEERTGRSYCPDGDAECRYKHSGLGCTYCAFEKAIEIVKKDGVDAKQCAVDAK